MDGIITEKKYPIRNIWFFKRLLSPLIIFPIWFYFFISINRNRPAYLLDAIFLLPFIFGLILLFGIPVIIDMLRRSNFHYSLEEKFMVFNQGIISKQNRNVPYGVVQEIFVHQGLFDKIFGLASLTIDDFSQGGKSFMDIYGNVGNSKSKHEAIGFAGNRIHIPGLKKEDAEELKNVILHKVKENQVEDSRSGL